jgi:hypothetical protein
VLASGPGLALDEPIKLSTFLSSDVSKMFKISNPGYLSDDYGSFRMESLLSSGDGGETLHSSGEGIDSLSTLRAGEESF